LILCCRPAGRAEGESACLLGVPVRADLRRVRSKTPPEGYSVFLSYERSTCETAIEHPRVAFSNASFAPLLALARFFPTLHKSSAPLCVEMSFLSKNKPHRGLIVLKSKSSKALMRFSPVLTNYIEKHSPTPD